VDWVDPAVHFGPCTAPRVAIYVIDLFRENSAYSRIAAPDEHGHSALLGGSPHVCACARSVDRSCSDVHLWICKVEHDML